MCSLYFVKIFLAFVACKKVQIMINIREISKLFRAILLYVSADLPTL